MTEAQAGETQPLTDAERAEIDAEVLGFEAEEQRRSAYKIRRYFPDTGPLRRELYVKHLMFFAAGAKHRERLFMKANRVGGTDAGAYETALHLTGEYDKYAPWWQGRRFKEPVRWWSVGDTGKTTRDILQLALLGPINAVGTGMIPAHAILDYSMKSGVPEAIETVRVRHRSGGESLLMFKSYDQRREAFQGTAQHGIHLDEEVPEDIYTECLLRTMDTPELPGGGLILLTFTPLQGMTPLVMTFLRDGQIVEGEV
jgi:phage terminase large subunit-like protein